jgi:hypothetical protein
MFLKRVGRCAKLLFDQRNSTAHASSRNFAFREALNSSKGDKIAKTVESLTPASPRVNKSQAFPVAKTARVDSQDAPHFSLGIALCQADDPPHHAEFSHMIMHPVSTTWPRRFESRLEWTIAAANNHKRTSGCTAPEAC